MTTVITLSGRNSSTERDIITIILECLITCYYVLPLCYQGEKDGPGEAVPTLWLAPESLYKAQYSQSTEVYTLAHALLEVLSYGVHPYQEMGNVSAARKITTVSLESV